MDNKPIERIKEIKVETVLLDEWEKFKELWLTALTTDPQAFGRSFEETNKYTKKEWQDIIKCNLDKEGNDKVFVAKVNSIFAGMMSCFSKKEDDSIAKICGVYIKKEYRGKEVSSQLMQTVLDSLSKKFVTVDVCNEFLMKKTLKS